MFRFLLLVLLAIFLLWCTTKVKLGEYSCAGHLKRIWNSQETQDFKKGVEDKATSESTKELVHDIEEKAAPVVEKVKRGVKAGVKEASEPEPAAPIEDGGEHVDSGEHAARKTTEPAHTKPAGDAGKKPARK